MQIAEAQKYEVYRRDIQQHYSKNEKIKKKKS